MRYALAITRSTRPQPEGTPEPVERWVTYGASVRAAQYLVLGAKSRAAMHGRTHADFDDVRAMATPVLRHRLVTNFQAEADGVDAPRPRRECLPARGERVLRRMRRQIEAREARLGGGIASHLGDDGGLLSQPLARSLIRRLTTCRGPRRACPAREVASRSDLASAPRQCG